MIDINFQQIINWFFTSGWRMFLIPLAGYVGYRVLKIFIGNLVKRVVFNTYGHRDGIAIEKRADTLTGVLLATSKIVIWAAIVLMFLSELGVNIGPLLAGAGVAGLAIGFGAQSLVKDIISGLFILFEDQYRKGDVIKAGSIAGLVEDINLRRTVLRDLDGVVHIIPNGEISAVSNMSKSFSRVNLDIQVAYEEDIDHVTKVLNRVGEEMAQDPNFKDLIIKPPVVLGVESFEESGINIKYVGDTKPLKQWDVARELRRRIKIAFDKEGIEIPYPHRTLVQKEKTHD